MSSPEKDPVIDEVREIRHLISERLKHDPVRVIDYYMELQQQYRDRLIQTPRRGNGTDRSAA